MAESRIAQIATSPLLANFAAAASQKALRPVGQFLAPICEVPDLTFRYKKYTESGRYKPSTTRRQIGGTVTQLGWSAEDVPETLQPNALDFPIPNAATLSDDGLQFSIMEGQSALADAAALSLEVEIVDKAVAAAAASGLSVVADFADPFVDPLPIIDELILQVTKASKNGSPIRLLIGATKFKKFRNNPQVMKRYIVGATGGAGGSASVGLLSPQIEDLGRMTFLNTEARLSMMVIDRTPAGLAENIQFLLDDSMLVFACADQPNRMDPSFMKTFTRLGNLFRAGEYISEDERDTTLKMDWTTLPLVTNSAAVAAIN